MKVLMIEAEKHPYPVELSGDLKSLQKAVGGLIQVLYPFPENVVLVCNDEGKISGLPLNRGLRHPETGELYEIIAGNFFLCGDEDGEFCSLTKDQLEKYAKDFHSPEMFLMIDNQLCCLPLEEAN